MESKQIDCNLVELQDKLLVLKIEDVESSTIRHLEKMLRKKGSKHLGIIAIAEGRLESVGVEDAKRILQHIIEQEEKKDESNPNDY